MKSPEPKKLTILLVAPHADDVEMFCPSACLSAVNAGWTVHESLACADEYSVPNPIYRGRRIAKMRKLEMKNAAKAYGTNPDGSPKIHLHWMQFIDGHVPFAPHSVRNYRTLIEEISPDIILGPDPFFPTDNHPDHVNTGKNMFYALKSMKTSRRPKRAYFYQTFHPDLYIPAGDSSIILRARVAHRTQFKPHSMKIMKNLEFLFKHPLQGRGKKVDSLREVKFNLNDNEIVENTWSWRLRVKKTFWRYLVPFGNLPPDFFKNPPVQQIRSDYEKNGWV